MFKKDIIPNEKKKENLNDNLFMFIKIGGTFIIIIFSLYLFRFGYQGFSNDQEVWAQFGDYFGGTLNPIFAFLAFIALLITIKLQNEALQTSKDELKASREELEKSRKAQEEQSKSLQLQNQATKLQMFENTFFELLRQHNDVINKFSNGKFNGDEAISSHLEIFNNQRKKSKDSNPENLKELFNHLKNRKSFKFFRTLLSVLILIDKNKELLDEKQIVDYLFIMQAQISDAEMVLFYYYGIIFYDSKVKEILENYSFFEKIKVNEKFLFELDLIHYDIKVFGKNEKIIKKYNELKNIDKIKII